MIREDDDTFWKPALPAVQARVRGEPIGAPIEDFWDMVFLPGSRVTYIGQDDEHTRWTFETKVLRTDDDDEWFKINEKLGTVRPKVTPQEWDDEPFAICLIRKGPDTIKVVFWLAVAGHTFRAAAGKTEELTQIIRDVMRAGSGRYEPRFCSALQDLAERVEQTNQGAPEVLLNIIHHYIEAGRPEPSPSDDPDTQMLAVLNSTLYYEVRAAVANGRRELQVSEGEFWHMAEIRRKGLDAMIRVRPDTDVADPFTISSSQLAEWQASMAQHVMQMDDLTADVLDAVCSTWIDRARHPKDDVLISVDRLLEMRSLTQKMGGQGRRGGYYEQQRRAIACRVAALRDTWVTVARMLVTENEPGKRRKRTEKKGEAPVLVVEFRVGPTALGGSLDPERCTEWLIRPGMVFAEYLFGPGRETALLARKALQYDPLRQTWEKRLARYFSWLWRIRQGTGSYCDPITVHTLLEAVREELNDLRPNRTKERLEKALEQLQEDGIIARGWQYTDDADESIVGRKGWAQDWLNWKVIVEPPAPVLSHYAGIEARPLRPTSSTTTPLLGKQLAQLRRERGLSLMQVAEQCGVSAASLSRIERGTVKPSKPAERKIAAWVGNIEIAS